MSWTQQGLDINGKAAGDWSGWSVSLSEDGSIVAIGAPQNDGNGTNSGHVHVYKWDQTLNGNLGGWALRGTDIDGEAGGDKSGWSVSLSADGSVVAIGGPYNNGYSGPDSALGHVRVYKWDQTLNGNLGNWALRGTDIDGELGRDGSGRSVSLSADGSVVAIGAPYNNGRGTDSGHVRVYKWDQSLRNNLGNWALRGTDIDGEAGGDLSGMSVSLSADGSVVAIGAPYNNGRGTDSGHVRVYKWDQSLRNNLGNWALRGTDIDGEAGGDLSGRSVSLSADGSVVAIGAPNNGNGHVRVYKWDQTLRSNLGNWALRGTDINGKAGGDGSGISVSLSADGSVVAIGAPNNGNGHVRVYKWDQTLNSNLGNWALCGTDIDGKAAGDRSGWSVSLSASADGYVVAIGAPNNGNGHVRVYSFTDPILTPVCFLADAPVLTPTGYKAINSIKEGDLVRTAAGRDVTVKRVFAKVYSPSTSANPFVIPKGTFGALRYLPISPNHEVMISGKGMVKAKDLGLPRMKMTGPFTYYNLELEDWVRDNLVVAGVECESLAPVSRITMTKAEFGQFVKSRYGPSAAARLRLQSVCFEESANCVSMPALQ